MTWPAYLARLEEVLSVAEGDLDRGDLDRAAATVAAIAPDDGLPPLTRADVDRARTAASRLADLEARVADALRRLRPELHLLAAAQPAAPGALYVDHRG